MAAKGIMIQGTMSHVGKSVVTAGLCRILREDGYKVAPFKSQNMALNSYVTRDGLEMGRAQVMQAEAAGVEPSVWMNPILLKPTSEMGSQVIVHGEIWGHMDAQEYHKRRGELLPAVGEAYRQLAQNFDIIVLEGAGSPVEINLNQGDFVNMGMAKLAKAPVLLVGDIDRGGVFASLYGTLALLEEGERGMVKGLIVNKFRGDLRLFQSGEQMLSQLCQRPVLGVVPWREPDLDEEDSLSHRLCQSAPRGEVEVAVIRLPHISNFTDFHGLERHPQIGLRYVDRVEALGRPHLIILPGTKNTLQDLRWLRDRGLDQCLLACVQEGIPLLGICGGYQMLGQTLEDPMGVEDGGCMEGLRLLPHQTQFTEIKRRLQWQGRLPQLEGFYAPLSGCWAEGYEIHMGMGGAQVMAEGRVLGTYLHGFLDSYEVQEALVQCLLAGRGQTGRDRPWTGSHHQDRERRYQQWGSHLRAHLDMKQIYDIIEQGL